MIFSVTSVRFILDSLPGSVHAARTRTGMCRVHELCARIALGLTCPPWRTRLALVILQTIRRNYEPVPPQVGRRGRSMRGVAFILSIVIAAVLFARPPCVASRLLRQFKESEQRFQADAPPAQAEIVFLVLELAPGVWLPLHTHPGPGDATVLDGTMTRRALGAESSYTVGEGWVDPTGVPHLAGNDNATPARIVATFVIPKGSTLTTLVETPAEGSPGATTLAQQRFDAPGLPSPLDLVHRVLEVPPGAHMPPHSHPGPTVVSVLAGNGTLIDGGVSREVSPGVTWVDPANYVHGSTLMAAAPRSEWWFLTCCRVARRTPFLPSHRRWRRRQYQCSSPVGAERQGGPHVLSGTSGNMRRRMSTRRRRFADRRTLSS